MAEVIDGKLTSAQIKAEIKIEVENRITQGKKQPHLVAVLIGEDGASMTYVHSKVKDCEEVGFKSGLISRPASATEAEVLQIVDALNANTDVDGFIVQLPLPAHINANKVLQAIDPKKDVDGFHPENVGKMSIGLEGFVPATPYGIMQLLKRYNIETVGKHCVVIGRSNIVGRPMSILMSGNTNPGNCTVTLVHSKTKDLNSYVKAADILIVALGRPEFVDASMVKPGAVIIDVGITRVEDATKKSGYRIAGDVNYASVAEVASFVTPVPGGVGPMTRVALLMNTLKACEMREAAEN